MLGVGENRKPGLEVIRLTWENAGQTIELEIDDSIVTCDLLEVLDLFIRLMSRSPTGELDYVSERL